MSEVSVKVIGAGFGRTGTMSLKGALEDLGFGPCYHMIEIFSHMEHTAIWEAALRGEHVDWKALFDGWEAAVDWPPCSFYEQLMEVYPEAKVILNVRDPEKWYESATNTIYMVKQQADAAPKPTNGQVSLDPIPRAMKMINGLIWDGDFHGRFADKDYAIKVFTEHIEDVKRNVPPERLLVYEISQGWEPLCAFLDVPVPEGKPFPRLNDTAAFQAMIQRMRQGAAH